MRLLDRYLLGEQTRILVMAMTTLLGVLLLEKLNFLSSLLLSEGAGLAAIGKLLLYLLPTFLTLSAPLALLMSSLMLFSRLCADNEFTAMRACGISFYRLLIPVFIISTVLFALVFYNSIFITHKANIAFRKAVIEIVKLNVDSQLRERSFNSAFDGYVIHLEKKNGENIEGVFISESRPGKKPRIIEAEAGGMKVNPTGSALVFYLKNGVIHNDNGQNGYRTIAFERYSLAISLGNKNEVFNKEIPHLSVSELSERIKSIETRYSNGENIKPPYAEKVALYQKFASPLGCIALGLLGAPLGMLTRQRGSGGGFGFGVIMIVVNYLLFIIGQGLGSEGKIDPFLAIFGPNILMGGLGIYLIVRVSKNSMPSRYSFRLRQLFSKTARQNA
jgi:lipopolysaccharide export system permease protein